MIEPIGELVLGDSLALHGCDSVPVWVQKWLADAVPKLASFGTLRLVRDVLGVSGMVEFDSKASKLKHIVLNRAASIMSKLLTAFRPLLLHERVVIILGEFR